MKIKLHNLLGKTNGNLIFLFEDKILVSFDRYLLRIYYTPLNRNSFLRFCPETKKFEEGFGFGKSNQVHYPNWGRISHYRWGEMS